VRIAASVPIIVLFAGVLAGLLMGILVFDAFVTQLYTGLGQRFVVSPPHPHLTLPRPNVPNHPHRPSPQPSSSFSSSPAFLCSNGWQCASDEQSHIALPQTVILRIHTPSGLNTTRISRTKYNVMSGPVSRMSILVEIAPKSAQHLIQFVFEYPESD
jgi:hypothetical protein